MKRFLILLGLWLGADLGLPAQSTWTGPAGGQWGVATNWSPNGIPNAVNAVINWTNSAQAYLTVGGPFTLGTLNFLTGGGSLAFGANTSNDQLTAQTSSGAPTCYVTNGGNVYCYVRLAGTQGFVKTGPGTLTFRYNGMTQPYTGTVAILGGALGIQADYSLGNTNNPVIITNGASLNEASSANGGVFWLSPVRTLTLAGAQAQVAVGGAAYTLVIPGVINENSPGAGLLWSSAGELILSNANTFTGALTMTAGTVDLAQGQAAQFATLTVNGGTLQFDQAVPGNAFTLGGLAGTAGFALQNNAVPPAPIALTVGGNQASTTLAGGLTGPGSLTKTGAGTLTLGGANQYTGTTTVLAGRLSTATGSTGAGAVTVADGATNQVQVSTPGQTLITASLTLGARSGATLEFNHLVLANPVAPMMLATNLVLNGTNTVNIYGPAFAYAAGTISLLAYASKSGSGSWALGVLPTGMAATLQDTGSQLQLVITAAGNPTVTEQVSFATTNAGRVINPAFCGLSYEKTQLTGSLFTSGNTALLRVFGQLPAGVLRVGGNSVDMACCWGGVANLTAITPAQVSTFAGFVNALPPGWQVIYGINMAVNSPTNCAAEAAYAAAVLGPRLLGFEIGNEPDLYHDNTNYFPASYNYGNFLPAWRTLAAGLTKAVPGWAVTNAGQGWTLTGPAASYNTAGYTVPFASNEAGVVSLVTQHYYRNSAAASNATMAVLLTPDPNLPVTVSNLVVAAAANHLPLGFRMDESGSFAGGGNGVSSQFGAALWTLDVMFTEAVGGCQGVNFHGGWAGTYSPIWTSGATVVGLGPEFYGLKLFSLAAHGSALPASLAPVPTVNFTAYGVRETNGAMSAVLLNKETNTGVQVTIDLGTNVAAAQAMVLTGSSLQSTSGYTLGGAPIALDGSWAGSFQPPLPATNGQVSLTVLPMSAVWLQPLLPPKLAAVANRSLIAGATLTVTNQATDVNAPALPLAYSLPVAPAGATINPTNGLVTWRPLAGQSGSSNQFTIVVANTASLWATQSFWVGLLAPQKPTLAVAATAGGPLHFTIRGDAGPDYIIQGTTNLAAAAWLSLFTTNAPAVPFQWTATNVLNPQYFYRVRLGP